MSGTAASSDFLVRITGEVDSLALPSGSNVADGEGEGDCEGVVGEVTVTTHVPNRPLAICTCTDVLPGATPVIIPVLLMDTIEGSSE